MTPPLSPFLTVSQLNHLIKEDLEGSYRDLWVEGEISTLRISPGGHHYFTLRDPQAQIKAVFFRGKARFFLRHIKEGNRVVCHGDLSFYQERGEVQLIVDFLEPRGRGEHFLRLELVKKRLAAQGLFAPQRKRPLPSLPRTVGIITSPRGAAIRDIIKVIREQYPGVHLLLMPVTVQGEKAPGEIVQALRELNFRGGIDVIILARGGGAREDLAAFNTEEVARAVAASAIPVVSAVGHEIDTTLADLAADARAPTPSAAAQMVVAQAVELKGHLESLKSRLTRALQSPLNLYAFHLHHLAQRLNKGNPLRRLKDREERLKDLKGRLTIQSSKITAPHRHRLQTLSIRLELQSPWETLKKKKEELGRLEKGLLRSMKGHLDRKREALAPLTRALETLSPLAILERGYSITLTQEGKPITSYKEVIEGDPVQVLLHAGSLKCTVEERRETSLPPQVKKGREDS